MMSIRSLSFFNGDPCVVMGRLGIATVATQGLTSRYDTRKRGAGTSTGHHRGPEMATSGDRYLATSGDFFMATDTR